MDYKYLFGIGVIRGVMQLCDWDVRSFLALRNLKMGQRERGRSI